ncbi:MAG TPA: P1 family peptidase [Vicinamibacterales bacterium]|jgi:L-aminopeptidase/D-esterase-like protein|nr:P1 family peptidase [Vicinamibacterales bacterium]
MRTAALLAIVAAATMTANGQTARPERKGITQVPGIRVGHFTLPGGLTGCTVVLADGDGAVGGVAQRGGAPGTRETDLLDPTNLVERVNAIVLSGGSAFGLDAAQGVVKYLEEKNVGFKTSAGVVPIVPSAILFDLGFGGNKARPTAECGYKAAGAAAGGPVAEGNVGAGAGATVGKIGGGRMPMKSGIGSAAIALPNGLVVGAIVAVNAVGDIIDPSNGAVVAGARDANGNIADARKVLRAGSQTSTPRPGENTTIGVVATNAKLTKAQASRMALMADDGLARALFPSHTLGDGDTVFALATGGWNGTADVSNVGALAADVIAEAIIRAAVMAKSSGGLPSASDTGTVPARFR